MSDTTVEFLPGVAAGVAAYVREVRVELADLPTEDVDDLTGGMEADLSELAAESGGDLIGRLGSPGQYAAELRAAAGLPERAAAPARRNPLAGALTDVRTSFTRLTGQSPWLRSTIAFLVVLRPAWWLIRGYLAAWALWSLLGQASGARPQSFPQVLMALVAIVASVQLGRGWLRRKAAMRPIVALGNVVLVVVALVAFTSVDVTSSEDMSYSPPPGMLLDGEQVFNIYPYDSNGRRISGVRLFDQAGRPLNGDQTSVDANGNPVGLDANGNQVGVVRDSSGTPLLNVFPRAMVGSDPWLITDPANPSLLPENQPAWSPPVSISPLISIAPVPATPTATSIPTAGTTPGPTTSTRVPGQVPAPTATSRRVLPKPAPTPSSVPSASVKRSGR